MTNGEGRMAEVASLYRLKYKNHYNTIVQRFVRLRGIRQSSVIIPKYELK